MNLLEDQEVNEIQRTLRELPPRHIKWFTGLVLMCSDSASQAGWALLAIGSIVIWTSVVKSEIRYWFQENTLQWEEKAGVILTAEESGYVDNRIPVWRYEYSFAIAGKRYRGESYSVGKKFDFGQIAFIRYNPEQPTTNCIIGLRRSPYSWRMNLLLFIPALGLFLIIAPISYNRKAVRLLEIGDFIRGTLLSKELTKHSVRSGGILKPVFRYRFQFVHGGVIYLASCETFRSDQVEDEQSEIILYDKFNPSNNMVYDSVPNMPTIGGDGRMLPLDKEKSVYFFLPVFTIAVNVFFATF
jgi:hypothetical protein